MSTKAPRHVRRLQMGCCIPVKLHNRGYMHLIKFNMGDYYGSVSLKAFASISQGEDHV